MCGIVTIVRKGVHDLCPELINVLRCINHRGPDDSGLRTYSTTMGRDSYSIGMGHVRLSIIDLSARGHQPMIDDYGTAIVYNGEIYNYLELKSELKTLGHDFQTGTDTEVILTAYRQWGTECVKRFIGMWAFAVWDGTRLFLSRDRLGKKPLYFYHDPGSDLFACISELKGFRFIPEVPWKPDETMVYRYLSFAEIESKGRTFFKDIREFPAGNSLVYTPGLPLTEPSQYWTVRPDIIDVDENEAVRKTSELLHDSVRLRLRSDAPLGLSLSGGLDSTLLLSILNESGIKQIPVFSSMYPEPGYNEKNYFDIAVGRFDCVANFAETSVSQFRKDFETLIYHIDQPSKLPGPFSLWQVAKLAGSRVKVLIDGQGSDELAGGYMYFLPSAFREALLPEKIVHLPDLLRTVWANRHILDQYPLRIIWERIMGKAGRNRKIPIRQKWAAGFRDENPDWVKLVDLNTMLRNAIRATSLPGLLRYGDRINMAFGIENRCPFLDHRLVEYVSSLPAQMKIRGGTTKWVFRAVAKNRIPEEILNRRIKLGFPTPVGEWYRDILLEDCRQRLDEYKRLPLFSQWVDDIEVGSLLAEHAAKKADHQALLWRVLSIGSWLKTLFAD
jgi:asparagine synthase (glutamine-hydrolysing)